MGHVVETHINEIFERTPKSIQLPHNEYITGTHKGECLHEARALSFRTAHSVSKDFLATSARERIFLQIKILVKAGGTSIANIHTTNVSQCRWQLARTQVLCRKCLVERV
jgi:hypothetical protein